MIESTYDSCLLYKHGSFGIVRLQIDDTLMLADEAFAAEKKNAIKKFLTKSRNCLISTEAIKFNGLKIELHFFSNEFFHAYITLRQEVHIGGISFIKQQITSSTNNRGVVRENLSTNDQYVVQKVKGAYLAFFCQSEISFDLSYVAQAINFSADDIISLNKRLKWQMENKRRGLKYVHFDQHFFQIVVFTDSSFANNRDLSFQIDFIICIIDRIGKINFIH